MFRRAFLTIAALCFCAALTAPVAMAQGTPATPETAKPFIGDWVISTGQGISLSVHLAAADGKLSGEVSSEQTGTSKVEGFIKYDKGIALTYTMDYQGTPVAVVVSLEPDGEKTWAYVDFASGAFKLSGEATKKKA